MADLTGLREKMLVDVVARDIWRFNECPWDYDAPPEGMAQLHKQIAVDQAKSIVAAIRKHNKARGKAIARFVMTGERGGSK